MANPHRTYEIRCPIHGFISFNDWERGVISAPAFQRLRRIRQLAWTDYVYPGAMHNEQLPIQPVSKPILCNPYEEPDKHWEYDKDTGDALDVPGRREAGYWYKTDQVGAAQRGLFLEEQRDDLPLINLLRKDVRRWRESGYRGASTVTQELLRHWSMKERSSWRLFFCQREAAETIIFLSELRIPGRSSRTKFQKFDLPDEDLRQLLAGERPAFYQTPTDYFPTLIDPSQDPGYALALRRLGCKMATGSGKTVVMAMLISWAFCNRGRNPEPIRTEEGELPGRKSKRAWPRDLR